jgi:hypothetical protein
MNPEENEFDDDGVDDDFELPTTDSPSGIRPLNSYGHEILRRLAPASGEAASVWASRLRQTIPQVRIDSPLSPALQSQLEKKLGQSIPPALLDVWVAAPGVSLDYDSFLWSPQDFLKQNQFYEDHLPEIFGSMVFFGGFDGFNGAVSLDETDLTAYYWSHEEGFTGQSCPDIATYVSEHVAWYVTTFQPFCFKHGYVPRK